MFKCSILYDANYNAKEDIVINQGGTSSGKTYAILQVLFSIAIREKADILIIGQSIPNLKVGALKDAQEIINSADELKKLIKSYNKTDRIYEFHSGSKMQFKSFIDYQDAKSGKRDYSFFNEVNGIPKTIFDEIHLRTRKRTFVDYNPNERFWIHDLVGKENVRFIRSWHEHNPFLSDKVRAKIEAIKETDEELYNVYARGKTGKIEGLVFRNFTTSALVPEDAKYIGTGIDFGFTNDPTTIISVWKYDNELYLKEECYSTGLTNTDIFKLNNNQHSYIADSAEPKSIKELQDMGMKVEGANKGQGSINTSIDYLKRFRLHLIGSNINREVRSYKWKVDKQTGQPKNEPIDIMNHCIDAVRYVVLNKMLEQEKVRTFKPKVTNFGSRNSFQ